MDSPLVSSANHRLHLRLSFGTLYPIEPPLLRINVQLPHVNVNPDCTVCMDMLTTSDEPYRGWTPAYSPKAVLLQLKSLLDDKSLYIKANEHGMTMVFTSMRHFRH